ncbi:MAG: hypothetical protein KBA71_04560 [Opitutaceae bacterium]|nr:hypothetical protein [Opitutaceae bacterium]
MSTIRRRSAGSSRWGERSLASTMGAAVPGDVLFLFTSARILTEIAGGLNYRVCGGTSF